MEDGSGAGGQAWGGLPFLVFREGLPALEVEGAASSGGREVALRVRVAGPSGGAGVLLLGLWLVFWGSSRGRSSTRDLSMRMVASICAEEEVSWSRMSSIEVGLVHCFQGGNQLRVALRRAFEDLAWIHWDSQSGDRPPPLDRPDRC